jgi:phosphoribosylaminoimidazole carboxylase PurE protein
MGSASDWPVMKGARDALAALGIGCEVRVLSAHRSPAAALELARGARERGVGVIVAGAGGAAHLAGVLAAHTTLPVVGVPVGAAELQGLDALLSTVQMPPGVPVATVGIGRAGNAGILAAQILGVADPEIAARLADHKRELERKTLAADAALRRDLESS